MNILKVAGFKVVTLNLMTWLSAISPPGKGVYLYNISVVIAVSLIQKILSNGLTRVFDTVKYALHRDTPSAIGFTPGVILWKEEIIYA